MNHRQFSRTLVKLEVKLKSGHTEVGQYMTRDLNRGGVGIDGDFSRLKLREMVEVEFILKNIDFYFKVNGLLIRHEDNSIGVMFMKYYSIETDFILNNCPKYA
ncbi:MAG: PilZ domain-containing protein [Methylococcales bacterium]|nr:PilZ domain-containing protein [Methylococcales bacterium]